MIRERMFSEALPPEAASICGKLGANYVHAQMLYSLGWNVARAEAMKPIDMVLYCPRCGTQHIDRDESPSDREWAAQSAGDRESQYWTNPPHRSHLCSGCGCIWRPADVPTNGVREIATTGKADTFDFAVEKIAQFQKTYEIDVKEVVFSKPTAEHDISRPRAGVPVLTYRVTYVPTTRKLDIEYREA